MEAVSSLILANQTGPMINHELSSHALFFKFNTLIFHKNSNIIKYLYGSHFLGSELKGHPLIILRGQQHH